MSNEHNAFQQAFARFNPPMSAVRMLKAQGELASEYVANLQACFEEFANEIGEDYDARVDAFIGGQAVSCIVDAISSRNPSLIRIAGYTDDGTSVQYVLHVSQICLLFTAVKRGDLSRPKRTIGFHAED
jgi:hypothetical protein